jgi:hypothetical protein
MPFGHDGLQQRNALGVTSPTPEHPIFAVALRQVNWSIHPRIGFADMKSRFTTLIALASLFGGGVARLHGTWNGPLLPSC